MIENISEIKKIRRMLGLTQKELSRMANVSQSLVAKIESGNIDPSYSKIKKIMTALMSLDKKDRKKAKDLMVSKIIKLSLKDSLVSAIKKMKKYNISQLPVFEDKQIVGIISDVLILDAMTRGIDSKTNIGQIMGEAPPIIGFDADLTVIANLLKQYPLVIVSSKGTAKGIITKADMFDSMF